MISVEKVSIEEKYEDPTSNPVSQWCYVEKETDEGFSNRIDLIGIFDGIRTENELNEEIIQFWYESQHISRSKKTM